jgi:hypothetical protein
MTAKATTTPRRRLPRPKQDDPKPDPVGRCEPVGTCMQCSTRMWNIDAVRLHDRVLGPIPLHRGRCETAWQARSTYPLV